jgi:hypothetical protein
MGVMLLIRVDHPPGGEQLAVRGYRVQACGADWSQEVCCEKLYPREQPILAHARAAVLAVGDPEMSATEVGHSLWDVLLGEEVHEWWRSEVAQAPPGQLVRTILDVRPPELRSVPWELLIRGNAGPPFRSDRQPWVRAETPWQPLAPLTVPVQVLVVVGDRDSRDLNIDEELAAIHSALRGVPGRWSVELLEAPETLTDLEEAWRDVQPDVLHVISHGTEIGGQPALVINGPVGPWPLYPTDVDQLFDPAPRLVILNACRTADAPVGRKASWTFTDAFIEQGSAAVVAMQGDILSEGAVEFSGALYSALADGKAVDVAAALGRRAIDAQLRVRRDDRCWALPCLSVDADPDHVLPIRVEEGDLQRFTRPPYSVHLKRVTGFVNQTKERRRFWRAVDPMPGDAPRNLLVVTGEHGLGKSAMVLSALLTLRLRGRNVVYVDLEEASKRLGKRISWLTVLREVRDALWDDWLPDACQDLRQQFDHRLSFLKRHRDPEPWTPQSTFVDDGEEFPSEGEYYDAWIGKIFSAFLRMLNKAAGQQPLLVVLDSLGEVEPTDVSAWLCPQLLQPVGAEPRWSNLRFVVIDTEEQLKPLTSEVSDLAGKWMEMKPFGAGELLRLAREFSARCDISLETSGWDSIHQFVGGLGQPVRADEFATVILGMVRMQSLGGGR